MARNLHRRHWGSASSTAHRDLSLPQSGQRTRGPGSTSAVGEMFVIVLQAIAETPRLVLDPTITFSHADRAGAPSEAVPPAQALLVY